MVNSNIPWECRRYKFRNSVLTEAQSIKSVKGYFYKSRDDFEEYCRNQNEYFKRLTNVDVSTDQECPFCHLTFNSELKAYINSKRVNQFIDQLDIHLRLWNDGLFIISNSSGWHLVNELIIPKDHSIDFDSALTCNQKLFKCCFSRWFNHRRNLLRILPEKISQDMYHGMVFNQRMGQSVDHCHFHCYTTIHPLISLCNWLEMPLVCRTKTKPYFEIRLSMDDHPNLIAICMLENFKIDELEDFSREKIQVMLTITKLFRLAQEKLYGSEIPASIGWFLIPKPVPSLIHAFVPMKRYGTIQNFQGDRFRKFKPEIILSSISSILSQ